ncbi:hypothetical protein PsAD13_03187 [Pseudovibrio sp. Ad13]|uniref:hypothetical protein n=1 Tax=Pseudovibrio sp. Ad13 TaxID=989396 RepID=UPI0007AEA98D|nr:hypothetical protein [Pseudovibrio sp. Ad13]KZK82985.1 hypothetical protein PsAD13_03187 [Pseudovibrio sp. Ad13]
MTHKVTDLEEFCLSHIIRPYQTHPDVVELFGKERCTRLPVKLEEVPELAERHPVWWEHVSERLAQIGFRFPKYLQHPIVDLVQRIQLEQAA